MKMRFPGKYFNLQKQLWRTLFWLLVACFASLIKRNRVLCVLVRIRTVCRSEKTEDSSGLNMIEIHLSYVDQIWSRPVWDWFGDPMSSRDRGS